jgi:ABC-2 type transport system permease protein
MLAIVDKELREIVRNRLLLVSVVFPPLLFAVLPVGMMFAARVDPMSPSELATLMRAVPEIAGLDPISATQIVLVGQFALFFLMIPAMLPMVIASFSIIGEKQARSLEPLLATPISLWDLLIGKTIAAVVPAVLATWVGYLIALGGVVVFGTELTVRAFVGPTWLLSMVLIAPLLSVAAVGLAVIISSRVNDTRVAQQATGLLVIPLIALFIGQFAGIVLINTSLVLVAALVLVAVDVAIMVVAVRLFRREKILTEWR